MDAADQVLMQTSMAETQRRSAARSGRECNCKGQGLLQRLQMEMAKLQQKQAMDMEEMQLRLAIAHWRHEHEGAH
jgi:hypothetical protein